MVAPVTIEGRLAQRITLEPRDTLRYGYRFWLDAKTALPLKTQLVTRTGEVLEDVSFISISFPDRIADERLKPEIDTTGFRWKRVDIPMYTPGIKKVFTPRAELLPAGFHTRIFTRPEEEAQASGPRTRFIVSMASPGFRCGSSGLRRTQRVPRAAARKNPAPLPAPG